MNLADWSEFNVAMAGATAALAGLVIVAASVNIERIITATTLTARLGAAISVLVLALATTAMGLVPELAPPAYGWMIVVGTLIATIFQVHAARAIMADTSPTAGAPVPKAAIGFVPLIVYLAGGILIVMAIPGGMLLVAVACLLAIISALLVSWVVLVEVLR